MSQQPEKRFLVKYVNKDSESNGATYLVREIPGEDHHYFISDGNADVGGGRLLKKYCQRINTDASQQPEQNKTAEFKRWNAEIKTLIAGHRGIFSREVHWTECVPALAGYVGQQTASLQKQVHALEIQNKVILQREAETNRLYKKQVEELREENTGICEIAQSQKEALKDAADRMTEYCNRIAQLEEAIRKYCFWMRKFLNDKVVGQPPSLDELEQTLNAQDNQK